MKWSEMMAGSRWVRRLLATVVALGLVGCGAATTPAQSDAGSDLPLVVVTTSIWGDVVAEIAGDAAVVEVVMPIGADPHDFAPSSAQVGRLQAADLVVANGLGLEEGLLDILDEIADSGGNVLELAPLLDPIEFGTDHHDHDDHGNNGDHDHDDDHDDVGDHDHDGDHDDHDHDHDGDDPHVWQDPDRVAEAATLIGDRLADLVDDADAVVARAAAYHDLMHDLAHGIEDTLAGIPDDRRLLVTNHHSLGYFADRFHFEIIGTVVPGGSTLGDPSSAELTALVAEIVAHDVPAIFVETTSSDALAESLAAEVGHPVAVVHLHTDSLGPEGSGAENLAGLFVTNAEHIRTALE